MRRLLSVAIPVVLLASACSGTSVEDAEAAYCEDLQALDDSISAVQDLTAESTVNEAQDAADAVSAAYNDVASSAADYADAQTSEIESAREAFDGAVSDISGSETVGTGFLALQTALVTYFKAVGSALDTQCSTVE